MMDVLRFVNSKAIREHLRSINYQFNTIEAAYLIALSQDATFKERHDAWQEVIDTMPDMSPAKEMPNCRIDYYADSIHDLLKKQIENENKLLEEYLSIKKGAFKVQPYYSYDFKNCCGFQDPCEFGIMENNPDDIDSLMLDFLKFEKKHGYQSIQKFRVVCKPLIGEKQFVAAFNRNGQILDVITTDADLNRDENNLLYQFGNMWLDIPTPFKTGDILYDPTFPVSQRETWTGPFVYENSAADYYKKKGIKGGCDITDMSVSGYFQDEYGNLCGDNIHPYLSLEYYPIEKLTGFNRVLIALSNHLKGEIDDVLFARAYHFILTNDYANITKPEYFTDEGLRLAGIETEENIEDDIDDLPF